MLRKGLAIVALAVLVLFAWTTAAAQAGDTLRLINLGTAANSAPTLTLGYEGDADTELVHRRFWGGGFYGYGYAYRFSPRFCYNPRVYSFSSFNSFSFGYNFYRPAFYYPAPIYYYSPPVYYYPAPSFCALPLREPTLPNALSLRINTPPASNGIPLATPQVPTAPVQPPANGGYHYDGGTRNLVPPANGTYPYDGGPKNPVPLPRAEPAPSSVPLEGRSVSLPATPSKFAYPAYGEQPRSTSFAEDRTIVLKGDADKKPAR